MVHHIIRSVAPVLCALYMGTASASPSADAQGVPVPVAPDAPPEAQTRTALTLADAIAQGVHNNPRYDQMRHRRKAVEAQGQEARGAYLPSVDVFANGGWEATDSPTLQERAHLDTYNVGLSVSQLIYDGLLSDYEIDKQQALYGSAQHRLAETSDLIALDIASVYLDVIRRRRELEHAKENLTIHEVFLGKLKQGEKSGRYGTVEISQVRARLASAQADYQRIVEQLRESESRFVRHVGIQPAAAMAATTPPSPPSDTRDALLQRILSNSPALKAVEGDVDAARYTLKQADSAFRPTVELQLNAQAGENRTGIDGAHESASALVNARWNLFNGTIDTARKSRSLEELYAQKARRDDIIRQLTLDVHSMFYTLHRTQRQQQILTEQIAANESVLEGYIDQFDLGRRTLLDVLNIQLELYNARNALLANNLSYALSHYRLLALEGRLIATFNGATAPHTSAHE